MKTTTPCRFCGVQASLRCSRCKDVYYCRKEHIASVSKRQFLLRHRAVRTDMIDVQDWKRHKRLCVAAEGVDPRPIMIDAILFPVDATEPRMIKLACTVQRDKDPDIPSFDIIHDLDKSTYFDREPQFIKWFTPGGGSVLYTSGPGYQLNLYHDDCSLINGSPLNQSIRVLTRGASPHPWSGNVIGVRSERPLTYCVRYYNANMREDLPRLLDVFLRYGTDSYKNERDGVAKWGGRVEELEY